MDSRRCIMNTSTDYAPIDTRNFITNDNNIAKTTSYAVAKAFNKRHDNVLRALKNMKCSESFAKRNFEVCFENNKLQNGKPQKFYRMTERGFMFLVMGFTGAKADAIKESFINAFEWMSEQLTQAFQSKWTRYNAITTYRKNRKSEVSKGASSMAHWRWEKQPLDEEIAKLEFELQPQLPCMG